MSASTGILLAILIGCLIAFRRDWIRQSIDWLDAHNGAMTAAATFAIAVLTWFLVTTSNRQWQTMQTANALSDEAMRVGNRPYVQIDIGVAEWIIDKGQPVGILLHLTNAGNTPAEQTIACGVVSNTTPKEGCGHLMLRAKRIPLPVIGSKPRRILSPYTFSVGPAIPAHETVPVGIDNITAKQIKQHTADKTGLTVIGAFEYMNVFDEYCCQPFEITWAAGTGFRNEPNATYNVVCPDDRPNVCQPKSTQPPG